MPGEMRSSFASPFERRNVFSLTLSYPSGNMQRAGCGRNSLHGREIIAPAFCYIRELPQRELSFYGCLYHVDNLLSYIECRVLVQNWDDDRKRKIA